MNAAWVAELVGAGFRRLEESLTDLITQQNGTLMTTAQEILTDLDAIAAAITAEPAPLPAGTVAVAQADLDAIGVKLAAVLAQLTPPVTTPPVTGPPVTGPPVTTPPVNPPVPGMIG